MAAVSLASPVFASSSALEMEFSTFFGGEFGEQGNGVAVDREGNIYVVGVSRDLPAYPGSFSSVTGTSFDVTVLKLNPTGTEVLYFAVFGGSARERGTSIAVDDEGSAYVTGWTFSPDFPVTAGAMQPQFADGGYDGFVAKLNPEGSALVYSTYLGGSGFDEANALALGADGSAYVVGSTSSSDFPTTAGAFQKSKLSSSPSAFVARLSADGASLDFASYLGGSGREYGLALAIEPDQAVWVGGSTTSPDFPVTPTALQPEMAGFDDAFVAKMSLDGTRLLAATYLGGEICINPFAGSRCEQVRSIFPEPTGVLVAGNAISTDFPVSAGAFQTKSGGGVAAGEAFVARLDKTLSAIRMSTFLGGRSEDQINGVASDSSGDIYVVGTTGSDDFPVSDDAMQAHLGGLDDAFLARLDYSGSQVFYSTLLGGIQGDRGYALAYDGTTSLVITGETASAEFPSTAGVVQEEFNNTRTEGGDVFVTKLSLQQLPRFTAAGVVNAADFRRGPLAPGELISIFGMGLASGDPAGAYLDDVGLVASEIGGVRVFVNGVAAPMIFVSSGQINAVTPFSVGDLASARVEISRDGVLSDGVELTTGLASPAIFTVNGSGVGQGAILNQDSTLNGGWNPAKRGSIVVLYATGGGQTDAPGTDGQLAVPPYPVPNGPVWVVIGGVGAELLYAGAAPGLVEGVIQINARVPAEIETGSAVPIRFTVSGISSAPGVTVAIRK